ncbi:hypothetical protein NKJ70_26915 [Mesorhizobium sp. M0092]|uniref:hypothetical protein n=1 Tax=Mesorhizobium sp. M0092 TaxID=2956876 RepID=UPI00333AC1BB
MVDRKRSNPALWSRYAHPFLADALNGHGFVVFLRDLRRQIGERPLLVITDELALLTISEYRKALERLYHFRLSTHDTASMLHDKARFPESAGEHGWPVPNGVVVRDLAGVRETSLRLGMILKPADKRHFHEGHAPRPITANSYADAVSAAERLLAQTGEVLVQETVEGPDDNVYFCLFYRGRNGETLGMFTGQKLASIPPGTGSTAFCRAAVNDELERATKNLLDQVNYFGFGGLEYKRDIRSGRFLTIEPTVGRTDWQEELATLVGLNIPLIACRHQLDLQPLPTGSLDGRVLWQGSWIERIRFGAKPIPPRSVVMDGFRRRDDPLPALVHHPCDVARAVAFYLPPWRAGLRRIAGKAHRSRWFSSKLGSFWNPPREQQCAFA